MSERSLDAYVEAARKFRGNPSSLHREGREAAGFLAEQRRLTASLLHVLPRQITYTGGATESNAIVCNAQLWRRSAGRIIMSAIEHDSMLQYRRLLEDKGFDVRFVKAPGGYVEADEVESLLTDDTQLVCVMLVNNLLGTVQDIPRIARAIRNRQTASGRTIHFHCDASQAAGKIPFDLSRLDVDSVSFSAHKFQGPRGVGIFYHRDDALHALSKGGGQEKGLRPGTEQVPAIAAMNTALQDILGDQEARIERGRRLRMLFERELSRSDDVLVISPSIASTQAVTPFILSLAVPPIPSEVFSRVLSDRGFCVSNGSACSNNARHTGTTALSSMGFSPETAASAIRVSFSDDTDEEELMLLSRAIIGEASRLKALIRKH